MAESRLPVNFASLDAIATRLRVFVDLSGSLSIAV